MKQINPKLSIIIPVYNLEGYISACLNSICQSSNDNFEVVVIDDGSKDNSLDLCLDFSNLDSRVTIFSQVNLGVSVARNKGIELARGEYITFVDGDDTVEDNYIDSIFLFLEQTSCDIFVSGYNRLSSINPYVVKSKDKKFFSSFKDFYYSGYYEYPCWAYVFKRSLLYANNVFFPIGIKIGEDQVFNIRALVHAQSIGINNSVIYNYVDRESSALATTQCLAKANYQLGLLDITTSIFFQDEKNIKRIFPSILVLNMFFDFLLHFTKCNATEQKQLKEEFANVLIARLNVMLYAPCYWVVKLLLKNKYISKGLVAFIQFMRRKVSFLLKKI